MKINTLVIDDEPLWRAFMGKFVQMNPILNLVGSCASAMEAYAMLAETPIDLLICDIEMPEMSGISFLKSLRSAPLVIFVTAHRDYALACYEVSPVDFLMKPLEPERFLVSIEKVRHRLLISPQTATVEPYFFVRENMNYVQIAYRDVLYMKVQENFLQIITLTQTYMPTLSVTKMEEQLQGNFFLRVHRAYLVNRSVIHLITKNDIVLTTGEIIPIGDQYRTQLNRRHMAGKIINRIT